MTDGKQHADGTPENGGKGEEDLGTEDIIALAETGPRNPDATWAIWLIAGLCVVWSVFQLYIAYQPINSTIARAWHLAFAVTLTFLAFPSFAEHDPPFWVRWIRNAFPNYGKGRSNRSYIPLFDILLAVAGAGAALYIVWDYRGIIQRQGLPSDLDVIMGVVMILLLLEAARRAVGAALPIIAGVFLAYTFAGPYLPDFIRHRGIPLEYVVNDQYLSTTGIFGTPLGASTSFVFLFVLFGALLDRAGAAKYFIDVAFAGLGHKVGGPAKAAVLASGATGLVSGSSIANTVTTGTFTIPLMKKVGLPAHKAGAVEVAASTNGQLMPPVMGAAAFIMADTLGMEYFDVVRAAFIPAVISYMALFYVVHLEAMKLNLRRIPKDELPPLLKTFLRGLHYLLPLGILIYFLVIERRSPIASALFAIEALAVIMLVQRPFIAYLALGAKRKAGLLHGDERVERIIGLAFMEGVIDIWHGLINGARNMIAVGIATGTAGIIVGVVASTGLAGRFIEVISTLAMGNVYVMLVLVAAVSMLLGMGLPTTANYILMASLTAPVIVQMGADTHLVFPIVAAHLFVFYFGILADDTPPVGLAAYAAAAIAKSDPIRTGIQGFTYDMRTAILPFVFLLNTELLMISGVTADGDPIWIDNWLKIGWVFAAAVAAMFAFAAALQGFFGDHCNWIERILLMVVCLLLFRPGLIEDPTGIAREIVQAASMALMGAIYLYQKARWRRHGGHLGPVGV